MASVLSSNAFALLDDDGEPEQGAADASVLATKAPLAKPAPAKPKEEPKPGASYLIECCCLPACRPARCARHAAPRTAPRAACIADRPPRAAVVARPAVGVEARMRGAAPAENSSRGGRGRGPGPRSGEAPGRGRGLDRPPREEGEAGFDAGTGPAASRGRAPARGGPARGGRGPGGRGGRDDGRPARRVYDRHDGTGRGCALAQCVEGQRLQAGLSAPTERSAALSTGTRLKSAAAPDAGTGAPTRRRSKSARTLCHRALPAQCMPGAPAQCVPPRAAAQRGPWRRTARARAAGRWRRSRRALRPLCPPRSRRRRSLLRWSRRPPQSRRRRR